MYLKTTRKKWEEWHKSAPSPSIILPKESEVKEGEKVETTRQL
jgi:hypothetical protein